MTDLQKQIGGRIRAFRNAKGVSIEELAYIARINAVHLASLERGEKNITLSTLEKVVKALDISFQDLFAFTDEVKEPEDPLLDKSILLLKRMSADDRQFIYQTMQLLGKRQTKR